jgi:hypothetical protein
LRGGAFGDGLARNIRRAYKFLSYHYEPGDQIFVFGFSRGAYTARSLVGYIAATGLLKREWCTPDIEEVAWEYYRLPPSDRLPGIWTQLEPYVHSRSDFEIACVGVFDTVGALGVPLRSFWRMNRERYEFHDVNLCSISQVNLHALAIDEHRGPFQASIWRRPQFKRYQTRTEQVWFPGSHSDIGGGLISENRRSSENFISLDDVSLDWMAKRVLHHFPNFPLNLKLWKEVDSKWASAPQHDSRNGIYRLWGVSGLRSINNKPFERSFGELCVWYDRHAFPIGEMVHVSAIERVGQIVQGKRYSPFNVVSVLSDLEDHYNKGVPSDLCIVDWNGNRLLPTDPAQRSYGQSLLKAARSRLKS